MLIPHSGSPKQDNPNQSLGRFQRYFKLLSFLLLAQKKRTKEKGTFSRGNFNVLH